MFMPQLAIVDFYPRPPRGGRQWFFDGISEPFDFSTPALRVVGDHFSTVPTTTATNFYPRPPRGGRRDTRILLAQARGYFYPRPPRGGRLVYTLFDRGHSVISIHALREEGDNCGSLSTASVLYFYPRPPRGGRRLECLRHLVCMPISIHALREEGDSSCQFLVVLLDLFLSTPSARRATSAASASALGVSRFLSTPSARRATTDNKSVLFETLGISIHALREEGDPRLVMVDESRNHFYPRPPRGGRPTSVGCVTFWFLFLSTPSARRATFQTGLFSAHHDISIHALREEGDTQALTKHSKHLNFYPRPPRGGRQNSTSGQDSLKTFLSTPSARRATDFYYPVFANLGISIHALREEGDR